MPDENILPPRYRSPRRIAYGGMGEIFRAEDEVLGRIVAIKVLAERYARDESLRARFTREALAAARLSAEPTAVTIFDVGEWQDRPFIVMEYLGGGSLEERLREGRPTVAQALDWLEQAAAALDAAHRNGVVHRDVKPGNLLLDGEGGLRVADFGIASAAGMDSLTAAGTVLGTAGYLSPEQARGERATPASDRYALGVVAFELLTGHRPVRVGQRHGRGGRPRARRGSDRLRIGSTRSSGGRSPRSRRQRFETSAELVEALRGRARPGCADDSRARSGRAGRVCRSSSRSPRRP